MGDRVAALKAGHRRNCGVSLQLHSAQVNAVTETGCESLKLLALLMKLHDPEDIRKRMRRVGLHEISAAIEYLESGRRFYVGRFALQTTG